MSHKPDPRQAEPSSNPAHSADEDSGPIKSQQVTDRQMRRKNLPRGSEPETRAASSRR